MRPFGTCRQATNMKAPCVSLMKAKTLPSWIAYRMWTIAAFNRQKRLICSFLAQREDAYGYQAERLARAGFATSV